MEYHRGIQLGALHQSLGIAADARVSLKLEQQQMSIWDHQTGIKYEIPHNNPPAYRRIKFEVPAYIPKIEALSDDDLKKRWRESWMDGWSDERAALFSEMAYRNINVLEVDGLGQSS